MLKLTRQGKYSMSLGRSRWVHRAYTYTYTALFAICRARTIIVDIRSRSNTVIVNALSSNWLTFANASVTLFTITLMQKLLIDFSHIRKTECDMLRSNKSEEEKQFATPILRTVKSEIHKCKLKQRLRAN